MPVWVTVLSRDVNMLPLTADSIFWTTDVSPSGVCFAAGGEVRCRLLPSDSRGTLSPDPSSILSWRWPCVCSPAIVLFLPGVFPVVALPRPKAPTAHLFLIATLLGLLVRFACVYAFILVVVVLATETNDRLFVHQRDGVRYEERDDSIILIKLRGSIAEIAFRLLGEGRWKPRDVQGSKVETSASGTAPRCLV